MQHALVDQCVRRQADDVEEAARERVDLERVDGVLDALADHVELALEARAASRRRRHRAPMNTCSKTGCVARALAPTRRLSVGHVAPAEQRCPSSSMMRAISVLDAIAIALVMRQEHEAGAVRAGGGQRERHDLAQERVGHLNQDAGAVTGVRLAAAGAAVLQVDEDLQRLRDDVVRALALDVDDEADAAGVVFGAGSYRPWREVDRSIPDM